MPDTMAHRRAIAIADAVARVRENRIAKDGDPVRTAQRRAADRARAEARALIDELVQAGYCRPHHW